MYVSDNQELETEDNTSFRLD